MCASPTSDELTGAYCGKRILVTGHTGFKGAWLTLWLHRLGAKVFGYALAPDDPRWLFTAASVEALCEHRVADVRDGAAVAKAIEACEPDYVFHLAAQALVRRSYRNPIETLETNVMGTAHVLEAVRRSRRPCRVIIITSDKCYENRERAEPYREDDRMGGHDPYSMSKGATELVVSSFRRSFFPAERTAEHGVLVASARAGNVIGGGDWAEDRIVPDAVAALMKDEPIPVRNPRSVRPWQHALEPLSGYLLLGARLAGIGTTTPERHCDGWNFGPLPGSSRTVGELADRIVAAWGSGSWTSVSKEDAPHEAKLLGLSIDRASKELGWRPRWSFEKTVERTVDWYRAQARGVAPEALRQRALEQIVEWETT